MLMTLWIVLAVMSLTAIAFAVWPLYRHVQSLTPIIGVAVVFVVALSSGLYYYQGNPALPSGSATQPELEDVIGSLAQRLAANPDDVSGWKMLGRSYVTMGDYDGAIEAFEKAIELESAQDPQALVALGEALLASTNAGIAGRIASLFENALAIDPNNPQALFYGGIGSFNRGDNSQAADRWERLLSLNPPAEIRGILAQRIAEWRGEAPPSLAQVSPAPDATSASPGPANSPGAVVSATVSLSAAAKASLPAEATVFIIARDAAQPVPPIAVARRRLSELPAAIELGDRESMVPGRSLSGFAEFELIARVSISGQPSAQSGDWFGSLIVKPAENNSVELPIQQQVP